MPTAESPERSAGIGAQALQRRRARLAAALGATLLLVMVGPAGGHNEAAAPRPVHQQPPSFDMAAVDMFVEQALESSSLPGAAVAITRGDRVLHVRGYGHDAAGTAITGTSLFRIASLTEAVSRLSSATLVADPGTQWNYHNPNYEVAARLVEVASGQSFADYLRAHVFVPAGMSASLTTHTDNEAVAGLVDGHVTAYGRAVAVGVPDTFGEGAGDVVSTASDMAKWLIVNTNSGVSADGHRLVSAKALDQMHTASTSVGYGFGWSEVRLPGSPTRVGHTGNLLTFSSFQTIIPDSGYGVVLLFNSGSARTIDQAAIAEGVLGMVTGTSRPGRGWQLSATTVDLLLAGLTIVVLSAGALGVARSRRWTGQTAGPRKLGRTRTALGLVPYAGVLSLVGAFPALAGDAFGGRAVTWTSAAYAWPAAVILVLSVLIATLATLVARAWQSTRSR